MLSDRDTPVYIPVEGSHPKQQCEIAEGTRSFPPLLSVMLRVVLLNQQQNREIQPQKLKQLLSDSTINNAKWK